MRYLTLLISLALASLAAAAADPIEGRWKLGAGGASFEARCVHSAAGDIQLCWIDGPDYTIEPGTVIGVATPTATAGRYDCRMYRDPRSPGKRRRKGPDFVLTLSDDARHLTLEPYDTRRRISLWRWIPYLFRVTVIESGEAPKGLDAATRIDSCPDFLVL